MEYRFESEKIDYFIADFYCHEYNLIVEIDGSIHLEQEEYDRVRTEILEAYGYKVIRFENEEILKNWEVVAKKLISFFDSPQ